MAALGSFDSGRLAGAWYLLVTNQGFWRERTHPRVEYDLLDADAEGRPRLRSAMRFRHPDMLGRVQRRVMLGIDVGESQGEGEAMGAARFVRHGRGVLSVVRVPWSVVSIDPKDRWVVTWFERAGLGRLGGVSIQTRDPSVPQALLDEILGEVEGHAFLSAPERPDGPRRCDGLYTTVQDWIPPTPYRLGAARHAP